MKVQTGSRRDSGFLPQSKDMRVRLIAASKLAIGVNASVNDCLSLHVSPLLDWRAV